MSESETDRGAVVVTGASRGLGRHMALHLSANGFMVFAGVRRASDLDSIREESNPLLEPVTLDVADESSIVAATDKVSDAVGGRGVAGVVNNAAQVLFGPIEQIPLDEALEQFRVNVVGPMAVTRAFLPLIRRSRGRVVNVSSVNGRLSMPFSGVYSASKWALEAVSDALRMELRPWGISVSVIEPGVFATDVRATSMSAWAEHRKALDEADRSHYQEWFDQMSALVKTVDQSAGDPQLVSDSVLHALTDEAPLTRYVVGEDAEQMMGMVALPDEERDETLLKIFGQRS